MDLEKVKQFLEENKDAEGVKGYIGGFTEVTQDDHNVILAERDELLKHKPVELTDEEQALQDRQNDLWKREVSLTLKEKGLEQFSDVISVNDEDGLNTVVKSLQDTLKDYKVDNAYVPTKHATQDEYDTAKDKGDTTGMLKSLFGFK